MRWLRRLVAVAFLGLGGLPVQAQYVMDLGSLMAALQVADFSGDAERLGSSRRVYVARVSRLAGIRVSGPRLDRLLARRDRVLFYLQASIRQVPEAMKALERHGATLDQVIYLTTTNDGSATLYVDDR